MKNWLSWIVGGSIVASTATYAFLGDPLLDLGELSSFWEQRQSDEIPVPTDDVNEKASRSRLVQQKGAGRLGREVQESGHRTHQRGHYATLKAFKDSIGDKHKSTVQVLEHNRQIALGTIVDEDGWIVTKASEVPDRMDIKLFDGKAEGVVKLRRVDYDLALVKIERSHLTPVVWGSETSVPVGGWIASTDIRNLPIAIGVMSVARRNVHRERAVLGVTLGEPPEGERGALVEAVVEGSGADRAGVRSGDLIHFIDSDPLKTKDEVYHRLGALNAGQRVEVGVLRDGKKVALKAQMMDLNHALLDPTEMEVNGEISARSTGFQNVIQHDSVLAPHQCGGPIIDVHGNVIGVNIARAGRVSSYAIPASKMRLVVGEMLASVTGLQPKGGENVVQANAQTTPKSLIELPASVPTGIVIESLKPEVVGPGASFRP